MLSRGVLASAPLRMGGAGTSGAHSLASSVVSLVFFIVSFVFISFIVIMSLRTVTTSVVDGMHSVSVTHRRGQRRRRACLQSGVRARCVSGQPADGQPVASDSSTAAKLFDVSACCRVRACALLASRARVVRACRACSARVCSCARQASQPRKSSIAAKHRKQSTSLFVFARAFLNFACLKLHRVPEAETRTVKLLRRRAQLLSITFWNAAHT